MRTLPRAVDVMLELECLYGPMDGTFVPWDGVSPSVEIPLPVRCARQYVEQPPVLLLYRVGWSGSERVLEYVDYL